MHSFVDANGKEWNLKINIGNAKTFRAKLDLIDGLPSEIVQDLTVNMFLRIEMLWHFCSNKEQAESQEAFETILEGEVLRLADKALWAEIAFFIQNLRPEMSGVVEALMTKYDTLREKQCEVVQKLVESLDTDKLIQEVEETGRKAMNQSLTMKSFTDSPDG